MFQSLLCWIPLLNPGQSRDARPGHEVSIFVVLDSAPQHRRRRGARQGPRCFNPCCVGFRSSTPDNPETHVLAMKFQSLLCWIPLLNTDVGEGPVKDLDVSILVVLDSAPQPRTIPRRTSWP